MLKVEAIIFVKKNMHTTPAQKVKSRKVYIYMGEVQTLLFCLSRENHEESAYTTFAPSIKLNSKSNFGMREE